MSWGARLIGLGSVLDLIDDIQTELTDTGVWVVGTRANYAAYVNFGTSTQEAQPFLTGALESARRDKLAYIARHTSLGLESLTSPETAVKALALAIERDAKERCPVDVGNLRASITAAPMGEWDSAAEEAIASAPDPSALRA